MFYPGTDISHDRPCICSAGLVFFAGAGVYVYGGHLDARSVTSPVDAKPWTLVAGSELAPDPPAGTPSLLITEPLGRDFGTPSAHNAPKGAL